MNRFKRRQRAMAALLLGVALLLCGWGCGSMMRLDCRQAVEAQFCAVRLWNGAGLSVQWGERQRPTVWLWGPAGEDVRLWPPE